MSETLPPIAQLFANVVTQVSRAALDSDPSLRARLQALEGQCVEVQCTTPPVTWHILIEGGEAATRPGPAPAPQVVVRGHALALAAALTPGDAGTQLEISGDNTLLTDLLHILRSFQPDLAGPMSRLLGADTAANLLGSAELGLQGLQSLFQGLGQTVSDQAAANFVSSGQLDSLLTGIDQLRLRVDRLAAKVTLHEEPRQ